MSDYISKGALIEQLLEARNDEIIKAVIGLVQTQPTISETEIIRKAFERVVERLEEASFPRNMGDFTELVVLKDKAIEIVKEECCINE